MNSDRIKEIQSQTAFPDSVSVGKALLQVWDEVQQAADAEIARARAEAFKGGMRAAGVIAVKFFSGRALYEGGMIAECIEKAILAAIPSEPANQCDGCNSGMPVENGIHQSAVGNHMCCSKGRYAEPAKVPEVYGCHCELASGEVADSCVIGTDEEDDCLYAIEIARAREKREDCEYWLPISVRDE